MKEISFLSQSSYKQNATSGIDIKLIQDENVILEAEKNVHLVEITRMPT